MSSKLIFFLFIHLLALVFFAELLRRVYVRSHEYNLKEGHETCPFGFIRLRHIIFFYILFYIVWVVGSVFLYRLFINSSPETIQPTHRIELSY